MKRTYSKPNINAVFFSDENVITSSSNKTIDDVENGIMTGSILINDTQIKEAANIIKLTW